MFILHRLFGTFRFQFFQAWVTARAEKDFSKFAPILEEWVALVRESSQLVDPARPAYDVALEEFEKGMTSARLDEVFTQVRATDSSTKLPGE